MLADNRNPDVPHLASQRLHRLSAVGRGNSSRQRCRLTGVELVVGGDHRCLSCALVDEPEALADERRGSIEPKHDGILLQ